MAYVPPSVGPSGLTIPSYTDILNLLVSKFLTIFGSASYLGTDSADYQDIGVRANSQEINLQAVQGVYNSLDPQLAIGVALDNTGKLIGSPRKSASYSTALLTLGGTVGAVINNGVARDINGNLWNLPPSVTIGSGGTVTAIGTAQLLGNITANPGDIAQISVPAAGWTSVTNLANATPGQPIEQDSQYRARLLVAQAKPSLTLLAGTSAAVAAVSGVTRSKVYENPQNFTAGFGLINTSGTSFTITLGYAIDSTDVLAAINIAGVNYTIASVVDATHGTLSSSAGTQTGSAYYIGGNGTWLGPPHSVSAVVEGGASADIALAIYDNRGIGPLTNGTTTIPVSDPSNPAITMPISYYVLTYVPVYVSLNVKPLAGYTSATQALIQSSIADYLNSLAIGESVVYSELYGAALNARPDPDQPLFSIRALTSGQQAAQTTANFSSATTAITVTSATGIANGQTVVGAGIPANTTVSGVSGTTITISNATSAAGTGVVVSFFLAASSDIPVAFNMAAEGNTTFVNVNQV